MDGYLRMAKISDDVNGKICNVLKEILNRLLGILHTLVSEDVYYLS